MWIKSFTQNGEWEGKLYNFPTALSASFGFFLLSWKTIWLTSNSFKEMYRRWDGWMASPTQWTWVWANSEREWRTGKSGILQSMGSTQWTCSPSFSPLNDRTTNNNKGQVQLFIHSMLFHYSTHHHYLESSFHEMGNSMRSIVQIINSSQNLRLVKKRQHN